jgi:predicted HTH transcriptional regulator
MLSVIAQTLALNASADAPVNSSLDIAGLKTPEAIMMLLADTPELTRQQLADLIGKDLRTIARALARLQQAGRIKRAGSDKTGHWEVCL